MSDFVLPQGASALPLSKGYVTLVDEADFQWASQWKWTVQETSNLRYAYRKGKKSEGQDYGKTIYLHREIAQPVSIYVVDHINGNGLDNRRVNLRCVTQGENNMNVHLRRVRCRQPSGLVGVAVHEWTKSGEPRWFVRITLYGKKINVGRFANLLDARLACREARIIRDAIAFNVDL